MDQNQNTQAAAVEPTTIPVDQIPNPQPNEQDNSIAANPAPEMTKKAENVASGPAPRATVPLEALDKSSQLIDCPFCHAQGMTKVTEEHSDATKQAACLCCICFGVLGVWMPFALKWHQNCHHHCSNCGVEVAFAPHDGGVQVRRPVPAGVPYVSPEVLKAPEKAVYT